MADALRHCRDVRAGFVVMSAIAVLCALVMAFGDAQPLPVLGHVSLFPVTLLAVALGWPLLGTIHARGIGLTKGHGIKKAQIVRLVVFGALLALPPIAIDLAMPFPKDINVALPKAVLFYPAIAFVAEVVFHLLPLAVLILVLPAKLPAGYLLVPVVFVEPAFQMLSGTGSLMQSLLVFANVSLVSASGLWLFHRHGFAAMMALRLAFYLFWHIVWGALRLPVLF